MKAIVETRLVFNFRIVFMVYLSVKKISSELVCAFRIYNTVIKQITTVVVQHNKNNKLWVLIIDPSN